MYVSSVGRRRRKQKQEERGTEKTGEKEKKILTWHFGPVGNPQISKVY